MEDRCRGHCCRCFTISAPFEEIKKSLRPSSIRVFPDAHQVTEMLIPLGVMSNREVTEKYGINSDLLLKHPEKTQERFTCKNLAENGDCRIYESRPHMCRSYGEEKPCEYHECCRLKK